MIDATDITAKSRFTLPKASSEGMLAAVLLSFFSTTGLFKLTNGCTVYFGLYKQFQTFSSD